MSTDHLLSEVIQNLEGAVAQSIPSDDQIIMGRVRKALEHAHRLQRTVLVERLSSEARAELRMEAV